MMRSTAEVIEQALSLKASDRYLLLELLHTSLDKPDPEVDRVWQEEALRRVNAYDNGQIGTISMEEVFRDL
jgi:putative addiction module component (TIGR02574 family)